MRIVATSKRPLKIIVLQTAIIPSLGREKLWIRIRPRHRCCVAKIHATQQPDDKQNGQYKPERAAGTASAVAAITVVAAATAESQYQDKYGEDQAHAVVSFFAGRQAFFQPERSIGVPVT